MAKYIDQQGVFPLKQTPKRKHGPPLAIVIHYSYTHSPLSTVKVLNNKKLSTHYEVDQQGTIHQYADPATQYTLHGGKFNNRTIGIDITSTGTFPKAQVAAARELVTSLRQQFDIPGVVAPDGKKYTTLGQITADGVGLLRHRNIRSTACPGKFPMDALVAGGSNTLLIAAAAALGLYLYYRKRG